MPTLTIKNLPHHLHKRLRETAQRHHRSINGEVIACLEQTLAREPIDVEKTLKGIRAFRRKLKGVWITDEILHKAKNEGRA